LMGLRVRTDIRPQRSTVVHELRNAVPILSSATLPALLMITALLGWVDTTTALQLAIAATVVRLAGLGWALGHLRRKRASWRTFLSGILLAAICVAAAGLKWWLTH
jgi:VIT1/CCC1 family predicted Fe2+/Mn2+ transporter